MKISFSKQNLTCHNTATQNGGASKLGFAGKLPKINAISSDAEYDKVLKKIYGFKTNSGEAVFNSEFNLKNYPKIKKEQEGLLLYAGCGDLSDDMNRFLSQREMRKMNPTQARDVVRVFDYSLKKLNDKFGKYSGFVFRQGFFPADKHQYISTTTDPIIAATLRGGICTNKNLEFSILKIKNGCKINEFQRKMGSEYAEEEEEILLSRTSNIKEIKTPYGQFLTLKNKVHKLLETYAHQEINPDKIRVFEEV